MLNIYILAIGDKMPPWIEHGYLEYQKRIKGRFKLNLVEIPAIKRGKNTNIKRISEQEDKKLLDAIPNNAYVIALDRTGKSVSTTEISKRIEDWLQIGQPVALLIGGPEGLTPQLLNQAHEIWSLSALTFAHPLVRVLLAEQFYRCHSILEGLPYHR